MQNLNFLPEWYKEKEITRTRIIFQRIFIILIIINLLLVYLIFRNVDELALLNLNLEQLKSKVSTRTSVVSSSKENSKEIINWYNIITKEILNNQKIRTVNLTEKEAVIEIEVERQEAYISFINSIKEDRRIVLTEVSVVGEKENRALLRITLSKT